MGFGYKETSKNSSSLTHHVTIAPIEGMGLPYEWTTQCWERLQITIGCFTSGTSSLPVPHSYHGARQVPKASCPQLPTSPILRTATVCLTLVSNMPERSVCAVVTEADWHLGKQGLKGSWNVPLEVKGTSDLDLLAPLFLNCKILTVTDYALHKANVGKYTNRCQSVKPCCCEHWEGNLGEKFRLRKKILVMYDRLDLLAEQHRKNTASRNSAQSLLCTDMTKNSTRYQ